MEINNGGGVTAVIAGMQIRAQTLVPGARSYQRATASPSSEER